MDKRKLEIIQLALQLIVVFYFAIFAIRLFIIVEQSEMGILLEGRDFAARKMKEIKHLTFFLFQITVIPIIWYFIVSIWKIFFLEEAK